MTRDDACRQVIAEPFYTRVWTEKFGQSAITSEVLGMDGAKNYAKENQMTETWDASLGQNVATVETSDARYTIWMEDEQSMEEKLKVTKRRSRRSGRMEARIRVRRRLESDFRIY